MQTFELKVKFVQNREGGFWRMKAIEHSNQLREREQFPAIIAFESLKSEK